MEKFAIKPALQTPSLVALIAQSQVGLRCTQGRAVLVLASSGALSPVITLVWVQLLRTPLLCVLVLLVPRHPSRAAAVVMVMAAHLVFLHVKVTWIISAVEW